MTREEQKIFRRKEIIEKSLDLFIANGYAQTKINDIAKAVNMSVGLLFHYYESKEALYESLIDFGIQGTKSVMKIQANSTVDFFEIAAEAVLGLHKIDMFAVKMFVFMNQATHNNALPQHIKDKLTQLNTMEQSAQLIKRGQLSGEIREGDPMALSISFWCAIQGIMELLALHPELETPKAEWLVDILRKKS